MEIRQVPGEIRLVLEGTLRIDHSGYDFLALVVGSTYIAEMVHSMIIGNGIKWVEGNDYFLPSIPGTYRVTIERIDNGNPRTSQKLLHEVESCRAMA